MNVFDYFFKTTKDLKKDFVLNRNDSISFKDLYCDSLKVASYLSEKLGKDKNVILVSHNNVFFISVYLGILKSGNVCVPLSFEIEQDNLDHILKITESSMVFASHVVLKKLNFNDPLQIINEEEYKEIIKDQSIADFNSNNGEDELAEIIFTSGSTGEPKGVMISHKNIMANTSSIIEYLKLSSNDTVCCVLPFYYCYGLSLLHTHLKVGGSMVLNNSFMFLGTVINDLLIYRCTGFAGVPSHFQMLLKKSTSFKTTNFPNLRYVTQAGGKLHNVFIKEFINTFPDKAFFVMYGQTEATARLSYLQPEMIKEKLGSIGKAIPNVELKVVDKNCNQVGINEEGELIARGNNIMLGYYKDLHETSKVIRNNWLYTGDIAKVDDDGYFYIIGRKKEIIKVGGKRVSPKEIEEVILNVPDVLDCSIVGIYDDIQGESLKAQVVVSDLGNKHEIEELILK